MRPMRRNMGCDSGSTLLHVLLDGLLPDEVALARQVQTVVRVALVEQSALVDQHRIDVQIGDVQLAAELLQQLVGLDDFGTLRPVLARLAAGIDAVTVKLPMAYAGRYVAENEGPVGIAKFVFDKKYRTLVGAHVMSNYSSEFILACAVMIEKEMTVDAIREIVYPHPSVSEIIREAAFAVKL